MEGSVTTYGSPDVARAAGLRRATLDTWLARRYLPLPEGPGTGRSREYTLLDAIRVAAMAHLTAVGVTPARAGWAVTAIGRVPQYGDLLISTADPVSGMLLAIALDADAITGAPSERDILAAMDRIPAVDAVHEKIRPPGRYQLDLHELGKQVYQGLHDPEWRPDIAGIETRGHEVGFVLHVPAARTETLPPDEVDEDPPPPSKRRARRK
jgi:hypothetical protein